MTARPNKNLITQMIEDNLVELQVPVNKARNFLNQIKTASNEDLNEESNTSATWDYIDNRNLFINKGLKNINWSINDLVESRQKLEELQSIIERIQIRMNNSNLSTSLAKSSVTTLKKYHFPPSTERENYVFDYESSKGGKTKKRKPRKKI
jgi:hypothetical protein